MAFETKTSFIIACLSSVLLLCSMQNWKTWLAASAQHNLLGGLAGSFIFIFMLTAMGNVDKLLYGKTYQLGLFPEVTVALVVAVASAGNVHRVAGTSCLLLSLMALFCVNSYSQKVHAKVTLQPVVIGKKKKNN